MTSSSRERPGRSDLTTASVVNRPEEEGLADDQAAATGSGAEGDSTGSPDGIINEFVGLPLAAPKKP